MGAHPAGHQLIRFHDQARGRPVLVDAWYPTQRGTIEAEHTYGLGRGRVAEGAAVTVGPRPVIVLSHGAFGAANNYAWIGEHLARSGYLVIGVSHFGESYIYGPGTIDPASATRPWTRPQDCSFALDAMSRHSTFGAVVDDARVGALGHSSGGATVIQLAGATYDPSAMERYCSSAVGVDRGCGYAEGAPALSTLGEEARRSYRDPRVRAVVALDPALGPGHSTASLAAVGVPIHVVGAVDNDFLPFEAHAAHYARSIPGASLTRLEDGEGHFAYLDVCDGDREANGVPLCRDRPGVDRTAVHARLAEIVTGVFDRHLRSASEPRRYDRPGSTRPDS